MLKLAVFLAIVCFVACQASEYELRKRDADFLMKIVEDVKTNKWSEELFEEIKDSLKNMKDRRSFGVSDNAAEDALRKMMKSDKRRVFPILLALGIGEAIYEVGKLIFQKRKSYENPFNALFTKDGHPLPTPPPFLPDRSKNDLWSSLKRPISHSVHVA